MASSVEADDSSVVDDVPAESTVPEAAPARRATPIVVPARSPERTRRSTVASPIPALLAASMRPSGTPARPRTRTRISGAIPIAAGSVQDTSRISDRDRAALLGDDDEDDEDYVVEIGDAASDKR